MKIQSYLQENIFQLFTTHENSVLPLGEFFSKWQLFTKTCSFYRLGFGGHSAPNRPISDQHFPSLFDRIWPDLTGFDWIWPDLTKAPVLECSIRIQFSVETISDQHFPTTFWPLTLWFFFYSSPDSSHTLWWIVEYSGGETSTLCQLEVSVWPCVCSTGWSRLVTHPGTNPARRCLTSVIWQEPVCHRHLVVDKNAQEW